MHLYFLCRENSKQVYIKMLKVLINGAGGFIFQVYTSVFFRAFTCFAYISFIIRLF